MSIVKLIAPEMTYENTARVVDDEPAIAVKEYDEPTEKEKELIAFIQDHAERWRDYRDQNHMEMWLTYERTFRGIWDKADSSRASERSRIISPATQQAIETRHAEIMEAIFGQGEFFDIKDDLLDANKNPIDVEELKAKLNEDFKRDKILKAFDQIELMAEIYGTGIGEIVIGKETVYTPHTQPIDAQTSAYGVREEERITVKLSPINPKNFLFDPNGTDINDCMGVATEKYVSIHKIMAGIASGMYRNVDIGEFYDTDELEPTQEKTNFKDQKVLLLTYYGLVPREYLNNDNVVNLFPEDKNIADAVEDYADMVEAIVVLANDLLLKAEESPYMMKDRPIISYQDDTVPNRLLGRGTAEKAYNMQAAIDAQIRCHLDALALTVAPMIAMDATRLPRGAKFEVKPGKAFMTNGNPAEILFPFKFGTSDGAAMATSKEFERMLLMATGTTDAAGAITPTSRDVGGLNPAVAGMIKKYKRTLVNFQEDFLIPFINKAAWRYMQFDPERYPSVDVKFLPTATLGIIAREYEQQQIAFLIQTLGGNSPLTPVLMKGVLQNSSLSTREAMIKQLDDLTKPNPEQQKAQAEEQQMKIELLKAQVQDVQARAKKSTVEAQLAPQTADMEVKKVEAQMRLEQLTAENNMQQEVARSTNDISIEREQAKNDMQVKEFEARLNANNEQQQLEFDRWKTDYDNTVKLMIAGMKAKPNDTQAAPTAQE